MPRACDMIADVLAEAGVEYVFGLPGGGTVSVFDGLFNKREQVRSVLVRHEQVAAIMADAYGRATGHPAVIVGQGVFMGSNASFGIMEAYVSSIPMVIITDTSDGGMAQHPSNQSGSGEYGSVDLPGIFRSMTKYTTVATTPKEAVLGTQLALKHAVSGRPGPACVLLRGGSITGEVDVDTPPYIHPTTGYLATTPYVARPEDIARAAQLLAEARSPVIVAGNGVHMSKAHRELRELAETLGSAVATSYKGKSAIPETHPQAVGMMGVFGQPIANVAIGEADVILVVGARLTRQDTVGESPAVFNPKKQKIVQIDLDPRNAGWTFPVSVGLVGDAREVLAQLVKPVRDLLKARPVDVRGRVQRLQERKKKLSYWEHPSAFMESSPVLPQRLVRVLQETLAPDALIALDAGNNRVWMGQFFRAQREGTFFSPGGLAGMGWALPAAVALKLVHPGKPVVAVAGDGGFLMTVNALATAVQNQLPVLSVVMNDSSLGMIRQPQGTRVYCSEFGSVNYAEIAHGFGAYGVQVRDSRELADALRGAIASGRPAVVDVVIDRDANIGDFRSTPERLAKLVEVA